MSLKKEKRSSNSSQLEIARMSDYKKQITQELIDDFPQDQLNPQRNSSRNNEEMVKFKESERRGILLNNFKVIFCLNFIPLIALFFSLIFYQWYLIYKRTDSQSMSYWVHLLFVYDEFLKEYSTMEDFRDNKCKRSTDMTNQNICPLLIKFKIAGFISFLFLSIGIFMHIYNLVQMFCILIDRASFLKGKLCFKQRRIQTVVIICYLGSLCFWFLASGILDHGIAGLGMCFYVALAAAIIYALTTFYFSAVKRELKKSKLVYQLMNPDAII
jgi:hypothetical protein